MRSASIAWSHRSSLNGFGHHVIVHHETAADIDNDSVADQKAVLLIGRDGLLIAFVNGENERASLARAFHGCDQRLADAAALMPRVDVDLVQFSLRFLRSI